jgi:cysteine-rich repeat protein
MRWALLGVVLAGCIESDLVSCPGDELCPVGTQCDTIHGGCITPDQATACRGLADHTDCRAGTVIGYCLDQICVEPGCGNHIIDPGEICDDGNRVDGDGCSATCTSREVCGDGAVDPRLGEQCDDGNLQSHDGCDSRCLTETATWTVEPLGPSRAEPHWTTYDAQLGKVVLFADGYVWTWDGTRWAVAASGGPRLTADYDVVYDTARSRLVVVAAHPQMGDSIDPNPPRDQIYEWDGTTWTMTAATNAPGCSQFVAAYDSAHGTVVGFGVDINGNAKAATYNATTLAWTATPSIAAIDGIMNFTMAFDRGRGRAVLIGALANGSEVVGEWTGTSWGTTTTTLAATAGWSAYYDAGLAKVVVVGTQAFTGATPVQSWSGTTWANLTPVDQVLQQPSVAYDEARGVRVVFGGGGITGYQDAVYEAAGTTWTAVARTASPPDTDHACSYDDARARLVCVGNSESWTYGGTWNRVGDAGDLVNAVGYDPVRGAVVAATPSQLLVLGDTGWQALAVTGGIDMAYAITFDPTTQSLVVFENPGFSSNTMTVMIDEHNQAVTFASPSLTSLAFDARNRAVVGTASFATFQLAGQMWSSIVGPGSGFQAVTNARRGTVELVGSPHDVERVGAAWIDVDPAPIQVTGSAAFAQSTGELFWVGADGDSRFLLRRHWDSATPFEDCTGSADLDGDGLVGCDDPDCWTQCHPACPPLTTCP